MIVFDWKVKKSELCQNAAPVQIYFVQYSLANAVAKREERLEFRRAAVQQALKTQPQRQMHS